MKKKIFIGLGVVLVAFVALVSTRPATFHVERSLVIAAPPSAVFRQVNDFHAWQAWSPWEKLDPSMKKTFEGPASGAGSRYAWVGNKDVGEGVMTIERSEEPSRVEIKLEFLKPFEATNQTTFTFVPSAEGTKVVWAMDGKNNFVSKAMQLFMNMDKMVGGDFERGLAAMKTAAESSTSKK